MQNKCNYSLFIFLILLSSCVGNTKKGQFIFPEGGYAYPHISYPSDTNFYWYPLKELMTPIDSIYMVYGGSDLYKSFQESNLSLKPESKAKFRLISGSYPAIIIIITESELIIKQSKSGSVYPYTDQNKLTKSEYEDLNFLTYNYPLKKKNLSKSEWRNKWLDSLVVVRPELLSAKYYLTLLEKGKTFAEEKFTYNTKRVSISHTTFRKIIDTINASGYWSHSYQVPCNSHPTDASSYILEANTPEKYNVVRVDDCENNPSPIAVVFQHLFNLAGVRDKAHIIGTP